MCRAFGESCTGCDAQFASMSQIRRTIELRSTESDIGMTIRMLCAIALSAAATGGCSPRDISHEQPFAAMIGREYRVIGDVDAYGIKTDVRSNAVSFVDLIPLGIAGHEIV